MKKFINLNYALTVLALVVIASSCKKTGIQKTTTTTTTSTIATSSLLTANEALYAGTVRSSTDTSKKDSVYMIGCYPGGGKADSVAFSSLPSAISTYLTANYSGYTFKQAFKALTPSGTLNGYVVLISYNGNPVGLKFDATGTFVSVLEQLAPQDMGNPQGFHPGGPFGGRGGAPLDTIALSALPSTITAYFTANYPADTLLHAAENPDGSYTVISTDTTLYATSFTAKLAFINRVKLAPMPAPPTAVTQANLPSAITTYLTTTYPGYVFDNAFSTSVKGVINQYVVFIEANSTKYAVEFNGSGTFVDVHVLR